MGKRPFLIIHSCLFTGFALAFASYAESHSPIAKAGEEAEILASFEESNSTKIWRSVNDGVMGGLSKGRFERTELNTLLFSGDLSLENGGGFASIRTNPDAMNLGGATGIIVKARGDGRTYRVQLRTSVTGMATSYRANLSTTPGEFIETLIPFSNFQLQVFGRFVEGSQPVNPADINSIGISIADKTAGPFEFEMESIKVFRVEIEPPVTVPSGKMKSLVQNGNSIEHSPSNVSTQSPLPAKPAMTSEMDGPLDMMWLNVDQDTRSTTRIRIFKEGSAWYLQPWGARCGGADAALDVRMMHLIGSGVDDKTFETGFATHDAGFKEVHSQIHIEESNLVLESINIFADGSGRSNDRTREIFERQL